MEVLVSRTRDQPERLGLRGCVEEPSRLFEPSVAVLLASDEEQGSTDLANALDGSNRVRLDTQARVDLKQEEWSEQVSHRTEANLDAVANCIPESWIDSLQNESLDRER